MFDFSWSEILVIGGVALVVIGPKDLPKALRTAGILMRRARSVAREFQNTIDEAIREADLEDAERTYREAIASGSLPDLSADHDPIAQPAPLPQAPAAGSALVEAPPPVHETIHAQPPAHHGTMHTPAAAASAESDQPQLPLQHPPAP